MGHLITVATCSLNQCIFTSFFRRFFYANDLKRGTRLRWQHGQNHRCCPASQTQRCHSHQCSGTGNYGLRLFGPLFRERSVCLVKSYPVCLNFYLDGSRYLHSWETVARILDNISCRGILIDVGMPVNHRGVRYNCRILIYNAEIILIRPKLWLANDGNYRYAALVSPVYTS